MTIAREVLLSWSHLVVAGSDIPGSEGRWTNIFVAKMSGIGLLNDKDEIKPHPV